MMDEILCKKLVASAVVFLEPSLSKNFFQKWYKLFTIDWGEQVKKISIVEAFIT